ncbi:hypothetical protein SDC9_16015 [bioreactor metagenome]|uniref:Uncharacterized protein n=1 Tax=bioreactor metagenome TaxID=1076179 RepID=A0A644TTQ2_9ZZZZ|nr:hypothetical protein [Desulfovibrio desulfuricans]MEA4990876.1 hypothetical protein [Desulfovibrio desulfuricans]
MTTLREKMLETIYNDISTNGNAYIDNANNSMLDEKDRVVVDLLIDALICPNYSYYAQLGKVTINEAACLILDVDRNYFNKLTSKLEYLTSPEIIDKDVVFFVKNRDDLANKIYKLVRYGKIQGEDINMQSFNNSYGSMEREEFNKVVISIHSIKIISDLFNIKINDNLNAIINNELQHVNEEESQNKESETFDLDKRQKAKKYVEELLLDGITDEYEITKMIDKKFLGNSKLSDMEIGVVLPARPGSYVSYEGKRSRGQRLRGKK